MNADRIILREAQNEFLRMFEIERHGTDIAYSEFARLSDLLSALDWREVFQLLNETSDLQDVTDSDSYWTVIYELRGRTSADVFENLLSWAKSDSPAQRIAAANVLAQFGKYYDALENPLRSRTTLTLEQLLCDRNQAVSEAALHALGHISGGDIAKILEFQHNTNPEIRFAVVHALLNRIEPHARNALIALSTDETTKVRDWATFGLGRMGLGSISETDNPDIRNALIARLDDLDEDTRAEAIAGLAERKDKRVIPAILKALAEQSVGSLEFEACAIFPHAEFLPSLEEFAASNPEDREIAEAISACTTGIPLY